MSTDQAVLEVRGLRKSYPGRSGGRVQALAGLDFALPPGRSLAIVGESGSGKTTAALCIAKLALVQLQHYLHSFGLGWIDCQLPNAFLLQCGASTQPRHEYLQLLQQQASQPIPAGLWQTGAIPSLIRAQ